MSFQLEMFKLEVNYKFGVVANMGKTNKSNLHDDEKLSTTVSKYSCLYDKTDKGFKERDKKKNAWAKVEEELGFDNGNYLKLS